MSKLFIDKILLVILTILTFNSIQPAQDLAQPVPEDVDTRCSICLENMIPVSTITNLQCNHTFHTECMDIWLTDNHTCPLCRAETRPAERMSHIEEEFNTEEQEHMRVQAERFRRIGLFLETRAQIQNRRIGWLEERLTRIEQERNQLQQFKNRIITVSTAIATSALMGIITYGTWIGTEIIQNYSMKNNTKL